MHGFDPVLLLSQSATAPAAAAPWLNGYLEGNGSVYALASGAMSAIDIANSVWCWLAIGDAVESGSYACGSLSTEAVLRIPEWGGGGASRHYHADGGFISATPLADELAGLVGSVVRYPGFRSSSARGVTATADTGVVSETVYSDTFGADAYLGAGGSGAQPYAGHLYAVLVLSSNPSAEQIRALLAGASPADIWTVPGTIKRCWRLSDAYEGSKNVVVPDTAGDYGGTLPAADATLVGGSISSIVIL